MKRFAFDTGRGEMFEIAHGAYVLHSDAEALAAVIERVRVLLNDRDVSPGRRIMQVLTALADAPGAKP